MAFGSFIVNLYLTTVGVNRKLSVLALFALPKLFNLLTRLSTMFHFNPYPRVQPVQSSTRCPVSVLSCACARSTDNCLGPETVTKSPTDSQIYKDGHGIHIFDKNIELLVRGGHFYVDTTA